MRRTPKQTRPEYRHLKIFAVDPMVARGGEYHVTAQVRFEDLHPRVGSEHAPVSLRGERVEVVDVDASVAPAVWLKPVDLDDTYIAMQHGLEPAESDPQFHQQMVYAVAMRTLEQFDRALGRVVYFRGRRPLRLVPHAFRGRNAFYHPSLRAVLFGYFRASLEEPGENLPGQTIFTCLSHDIIAHEVTHAVVDRLRPYFNVAAGRQVRAFHEAFADIVAVFQRLTYRDLVQRALQDAEGDVARSRLLSEIAAQFGQGIGGGKALRSTLDEREKTKVQDVTEEHALGAVLVAAIFEGFRKTYERRSADLVRIATGGTGVLPQGALHPDLVGRLTTECVRTAQAVLTMCIRAFDYLPPTDVTFGAFLRALVTADWELNPLDETGLRAAIIEACRCRGIFAVEASSLAVNALLLDLDAFDGWATEAHVTEFRRWVDLAVQIGLEEQRDIDKLPEEPESAGAEVRIEMSASEVVSTTADASGGDDSEEVSAAKALAMRIHTWFEGLGAAELEQLGMSAGLKLRTAGFHPSYRIASDGTQRFGLVVQLVQLHEHLVGAVSRAFPSGATLVIDVTGRVRFVIRSMSGRARDAAIEETARLAATNAMGWPVGARARDPFAVDYRGMHQWRHA